MSAEINIYNPEELGPPMGQYTHVTRVRANEFLFVAGMLSGDAAGNVIGEGEFDVQTAQVFRNIEAALKSAGASWANVVQFTTYLVHSQDIPKFRTSLVQEQAITARMVLIVGAKEFDRLFLGVQFSEIDGDILFCFARDEETADEMENKYALHISIIAADILNRDIGIVMILPKVLQ